ncbi:hypothetical protein AgCh_016597 [Apium graveolens]
MKIKKVDETVTELYTHKTAELKGKKKWVGHRCGRGGVNALWKKGVQLDDDDLNEEGYDHEGVHLGDEGDDHLHDEGDLYIESTSRIVRRSDKRTRKHGERDGGNDD